MEPISQIRIRCNHRGCTPCRARPTGARLQYSCDGVVEEDNIAHATAKLRGLLALGSVGQMLVRMVGRMELAACVWSPLPPQGEGRVRVYSRQQAPAWSRPLTLVLSPLGKARGEKRTVPRISSASKSAQGRSAGPLLTAKKTHPSLRLVEPCARRAATSLRRTLHH